MHFKKAGYESATTRQIAASAGIAQGTLFTYFPEKRDLLFHIVRTDVDAVAEAAFTDSALPSTLLEQVQFVFCSIYAHYASDPNLARAFAKEMLFIDEQRRGPLLWWTLQFVNKLAALVDAARARGEIRQNVSGTDAAHMFFAFYYLGLITWLGGTLPDRAVVEAQLKKDLELAMSGLVRRKP
jgi:AcrR family transcriptional regulator